MGIDGNELVGIIAGGATQYFAEFSPILYLVAGILLAFGIMSLLINMIFNRNSEDNIFDENIRL